MENTKYQYITLRVETEEEYKEAEKLLLEGWIVLNLFFNGGVVQFCKISE